MADDFSGLTDAVGAVVKSNAQDTATQIRNNAQNSVGTNPDQEAEYTHLARFTGAPIDTVRAQPDTIKKQAAAQQIDADAIAQDHPVTGQFLTDQNRMKLALDDIANMRDLESTSRGPGYLSSLWQKFGASGLRAYLGGKAMIGDIMGDQEMTREAISDIKGTDEYENSITPKFDTTLGRWSYNAISGLINTAPALAAGIGTGGLGTLAVFGAQGATEGYGKYRARGGTPGEAALGGGLEGGINIATSFLPVKYLSNAFGKVGAGQFLTGILARDIPMMEAQTIAISIVDTAIANPNKSAKDFVSELPDQMGQAAVSALFFGGFFGAAHSALGRIGATQMKADAAMKDSQLIDGLNNLATASKVRARDTETFKGFMDEATKDGPVENLYVDPRALQQAGVDVDALAQAVPSIKDSVDVAKASGSDIKIPTSDFATTLAGTDVGNALLQHLKTDPNGMSKAEADEYVATQGEQLKAEIEKTLAPKAQDDAFNTSRQNVFNDVLTKLGETGRFTKDVNEQYALLHSTFASYMGARLGMTPEEFYSKYHGPIVAADLAPNGTLSMKQSIGDGDKFFADEALKSAREQNDQSRDKLIYMNPKDFLDVAMSGEDKTKKERVEGLMSSGTKFESLPFLGFVHDGEGTAKVTSHEGRHRARALLAAGVEQMPVVLSHRYDENGQAMRWGDLSNFKDQWPETLYGQRGDSKETQGNSKNKIAFPVVDPRKVFEQPAYHGSPHNFERFDLSKVGTGEGAQMYGHGIYFAEHPDTAKTYTPRDMKLEDKLMKQYNTAEKNGDYTKMEVLESAMMHRLPEELLSQFNENDYGKEHVKAAQDVVKFMKKNRTTGQIYKVDIPDEDADRMMSWDASFDKQPASVQTAIEGLADKSPDVAEDVDIFKTSKPDTFGASGAFFYNGLVKKLGSKKAASEFLAENGVPGIKYLDQQSRAGGEGTRNFVVFDQKLLDKISDRTTPLYQSEKEDPTETPEFKKWFGDSAVIDQSTLKPLVVYHGTKGDFDTFRKEGKGFGSTIFGNYEVDRSGIFFAEDPKFASEFATSAEEKGGSVMPVYLSIKEPLDLIGGLSLQDEQRLEAAGLNMRWMRNIGDDWELFDGEDGKIFVNALKKAGFDGVQMQETSPDTGEVQTVWVALEPGQIKSATQNKGTFDPNDPNILHQNARGAYDPKTRMIALLNASDLSTFLHESGHFFLDTLNRIAVDPSMPQEVKGDMDTALQWFGVEGATPEERLASWNGMSLEEQRPFHEQWARGFEKYLFEGKAPSIALRNMFQRFRSWMLNVYRNVLQTVGGDAFKSNISLEVRAVFDRMLASADEIKDAEAMRNLEPLFKDAKTAGMTDEQFRAYQQEGLQATQDAMEYLQSKTLKDMQWLSNARSRELSRLQRDADAKRRSIRQEVTDEVMNEPVNKARTFFKRGEFNGEKVEGAHRLDIDGVKRIAKDMYGDGVDAPIGELESKFGKYGVMGKDGIDPETAAEMFGFNSAQDLVHALLNAENPRDKIAALTDQRMLERYGNISDPIALQKAADEAVFNDARAKFLATEASALSKAVGKKSILMSAARDVAGQMIDRLKIRNLRPDQYANASAKAARNAEAARGKDDLATAAIEKRNQLIQSLAYKSANKAQEDILKGLNYLKKFEREGTRKALSGDYMSQIDALLDRFDLRSGQSLKAIDRRTSLKQWVEAQREKGYEPAIDDRLLDEAQKVHYKDMSVEAFRGLIDAVKSIEHLGRLKQRLRDGQEMREFNAIVNEAVTNIGKLPKVDQPEERNPGVGGKGLDKINAKWLNVKSTLRSADASLLKMEQVFDWLDQHDPNGTMNRVVFRRLADAEAKESTMLRSMKGDISAVFEAMPEESRADLLTRYELPELIDNKNGKPSRMLKSEILSMALNCANESNYGKMLEGEGWTDQGVRAVLDRTLKPGDVEFVNNMVATIEKLWPEIAALEERVSGVAPPKIEGRPFETKAGTIKGGYFPVVYDPERSHNADKNAEKSGDKLFENNYTRATTDKGHTIAREDNFSDSIYLSLEVIPRHLTGVIHDLAYREAVIDADRFLQDKRVRGAIEETLGREYYKQFRPWLQAIANDRIVDDRGLGFWNRMAHKARTNATIVGLGYRLSTMMIHGATAASNSIGEVGGRWMMSGVKSFFGTPEKMASTRDFVYERSEMMRNRMRDMDRDIRDAFREMEVNAQKGPLTSAQKGVDAVKRSAYYGIAMLDMASAMPTWVGAYNKALAPEAKGGLNMSEAEAIYYADKAVRNAHGGGGTKDLAAIQRGTEFQKLFTMFYSFWNHFYNRQRDIVRRAEALPETYATDKMQAAKDFGMVLSRSFFYFVVPQLIHAALKPQPGGSDQDENMGLWAAEEIGLGLMSGIPVLRDVANSMFTGRDYTATPAAQIVTNVAKSGKDIAGVIKGEGASDKWLKHAVENSGYVFGLPTGQASSTAQFLWDVAEGDQAPNDLADWWSGIVYGKMKE